MYKKSDRKGLRSKKKTFNRYLEFHVFQRSSVNIITELTVKKVLSIPPSEKGLCILYLSMLSMLSLPYGVEHSDSRREKTKEITNQIYNQIYHKTNFTTALHNQIKHKIRVVNRILNTSSGLDSCFNLKT